MVTFAPIRSRLLQAYNAFKAATTQRIVSMAFPTWPASLRPDYYDRTFENFVKEGYKRNEIIYACVNKKAQTAASVALLVHDKATGEPLAETPLQQLLKRPNRDMSEFDFWSLTITMQILGGAAYWQKIRGGAGQVLELWPIRPDFVRPQVVSEKGIVGYQINISGLDVALIPPEDMLVFKIPDPLNLFGRMSPIEVLSRTGDIDNSITDLFKIMLQRGATPLGILVSKLKLTDDAVSDIRRRWEERYGGYSNWTTPAVLDSDASYQRIGMTLNEMKFESIDGRSEARICMVLDTPPIIIGSTVGLARSTFSNYDQARRQWWEDSLGAHYKQMGDVIQNQLVPDFGEDLEVKWDFSKVPALQEERNGRWDRATKAFSVSLITRNMALEEMGMPTVGKEGDVFLQANAVTAVPNDPADDENTNPDVGTVADDNEPLDETTDDGQKAKAPMGEPLGAAEQLTAEPISQAEIDGWFKMYDELKKVKSANGHDKLVEA